MNVINGVCLVKDYAGASRDGDGNVIDIDKNDFAVTSCISSCLADCRLEENLRILMLSIVASPRRL